MTDWLPLTSELQGDEHENRAQTVSKGRVEVGFCDRNVVETGTQTREVLVKCDGINAVASVAPVE